LISESLLTKIVFLVVNGTFDSLAYLHAPVVSTVYFHRHDGYSSELCGTALPNFTRWLYVTMLMLHLTQDIEMIKERGSRQRIMSIWVRKALSQSGVQGRPAIFKSECISFFITIFIAMMGILQSYAVQLCQTLPDGSM
jgi:hypothetical protein